MDRDDLTPVQGVGQLRLIAAQARGNEDDTKQSCPLCKGAGDLERRVETERGYAIRWVECWLCLGLCMVTPEIYAHYARLADKGALPKGV